MTEPGNEVERTADESDRASALEAVARADALAHTRRALEQRQQPKADGSYEYEDCEGCGEDIGAERLRLASANHLCWHCASENERRSKWFSK